MSLKSLFHRPNASRSPQKTTYAITPSTATTTITCTSSPTLPSYHIPSPLTTNLPSLTLSSTTTPTPSALPRYRQVYKITRLPFVGYQLTSSHTRAQVHVSASSKHKSEVFLHGQERASVRVRKNVILDAEGRELANMFEYKTGEGERMRALELVQRVEGDERMRDLVIAVWVAYMWNLEVEVGVKFVTGRI